MEKMPAIAALAALAHDIRLDIFRTLTQAGEGGLPAGEIASRLGIRPNTLSNNLNVLSGAGLVRSQREGRSVRYFAELDAMRGLIGYLLEDCCGGNPDACRPLLNELTRSC
ncbi:MAG: metalloregulator ArsR/SmtB family transcription factor [Pseudomonadota bacterium]|nr:metalloregulator ArsR/SmtB family transcription factor [Pseudomonadota bacterium]